MHPLLLLPLPLPLAHALPPPSTEKWNITTMNLHFMTSSTGLPLDWPSSRCFNSTIDFDITTPTGPVHCNVSWPLHDVRVGSLPVGAFPCFIESTGRRRDEEWHAEVAPWSGLGPRRPELSFLVRVEKAPRGGDAERDRTLVATAPFTANEPKVPTSFLTCLLGPPLDGMRCQMHGLVSYGGDAALEAVEVD